VHGLLLEDVDRVTLAHIALGEPGDLLERRRAELDAILVAPLEGPPPDGPDTQMRDLRQALSLPSAASR
jgi:hypothetical protein